MEKLLVLNNNIIYYFFQVRIFKFGNYQSINTAHTGKLLMMVQIPKIIARNRNWSTYWSSPSDSSGLRIKWTVSASKANFLIFAKHPAAASCNFQSVDETALSKNGTTPLSCIVIQLNGFFDRWNKAKAVVLCTLASASAMYCTKGVIAPSL